MWFIYVRRVARVADAHRKVASVSAFALTLAVAFSGPALAGAGDVTKATDKASCDKAGGVWDDTAKKCNPKQ
jgi:hypothetical protein